MDGGERRRMRRRPPSAGRLLWGGHDSSRIDNMFESFREVVYFRTCIRHAADGGCCGKRREHEYRCREDDMRCPHSQGAPCWWSCRASFPAGASHSFASRASRALVCRGYGLCGFPIRFPGCAPPQGGGLCGIDGGLFRRRGAGARVPRSACSGPDARRGGPGLGPRRWSLRGFAEVRDTLDSSI